MVTKVWLKEVEDSPEIVDKIHQIHQPDHFTNDLNQVETEIIHKILEVLERLFNAKFGELSARTNRVTDSI